MSKYFQKYSLIFSNFLFGIYFLFTLSSAQLYSSSVQIGVFLSIPLYFFSLYQVLKKIKNRKKILLVDVFKLILFYSLVLKFMSFVNESYNRIIYVNDDFYFSLDDSKDVLLIIFLSFFALSVSSVFFVKSRHRHQKFNFSLSNTLFQLFFW